MKKISCTIGVLSFNSENDIQRCLESVKDFAEIVVADGGSTDDTVAIAREAGARILLQSSPGHRITDFSLERNRMLDAATQPWFFYLDSDEIMSRSLRDDIERATQQDVYGAYKIRYLKTNADASKIYRTFKEYYQVRLTRTTIGARFERAVHERIVVPSGTSVGQIEGPWYVPLDAGDLKLKNFSRKAWIRTAVTASQWKPKGFSDVLHKLLIGPFVDLMKSLIKIFGVRIKWGKSAIPTRYELLRILYTCMQWVRNMQRALGLL